MGKEKEERGGKRRVSREEERIEREKEKEKEEKKRTVS